jgi:predicted TIM-barrel fold metal-dependent hydrolase
MGCPSCGGFNGFILPKSSRILVKCEFEIFDSHTHIYPTKTEGFWKSPSGVDDLIKSMDAANISKSLVIGIAPFIDNNLLNKNISPAKEKLIMAGSIDPFSQIAAQQISEGVHKYGMKALKLHPRLQEFGYEHIDHILLAAKECERLKIPLIICSWCGGQDLFKSRILEMCHQIALECSSLSLIMAHAGGHRPIEALLAMKSCPNLYVDLSFSPLYFKGTSVELDLIYLIRKADPRRVLFGSDFPEMSVQDSVDWVLTVAENLNLSKSHIRAILGENAERLFLNN